MGLDVIFHRQNLTDKVTFQYLVRGNRTRFNISLYPLANVTRCQSVYFATGSMVCRFEYWT